MRVRTRNPRFARVLVDANFFQDGIDSKEREAADALLDLGELGEISIITPHTVAMELSEPSTPVAAKRRFSRLPYSIQTENETDAEFEALEQIMRGNAQPGKHSADAKHLRQASKWMASYFVNCDRRFHKKQAEISIQIWGLAVVTPQELLAIYLSYPEA